jgi:bifunctional non-homologous end joining protein LigD
MPGTWVKFRVNQGQEFVIGGYTSSGRNFDAILAGYYEGDRLIYVASVRNGFIPALRAALFHFFVELGIDTCPFANLPESHKGRWGEGLTAADMVSGQGDDHRPLSGCWRPSDEAVRALRRPC